eukprot:GHVU01170322.1.p1 GENE.GHVU01170322.1~~GHVU01170322.1.p1  ORF type:complete len:223 (+),score=51.17 GHVU01170322.1:326-994(+)
MMTTMDGNDHQPEFPRGGGGRRGGGWGRGGNRYFVGDFQHPAPMRRPENEYEEEIRKVRDLTIKLGDTLGTKSISSTLKGYCATLSEDLCNTDPPPDQSEMRLPRTEKAELLCKRTMQQVCVETLIECAQHFPFKAPCYALVMGRLWPRSPSHWSYEGRKKDARESFTNPERLKAATEELLSKVVATIDFILPKPEEFFKARSLLIFCAHLVNCGVLQAVSE